MSTSIRTAAALFITGMALAAQPALSASITLQSMQYSTDHFVPHFHYEGPVVSGDLAALTELYNDVVTCDPALLSAEGASCAVFTLQSEGGNYYEGLEIAHFFRNNGIATVVEAGAYCYSACAFAFLGGTGYSSMDTLGAYIDRTIEPGGILGFHAPYFAAESLDGLVAEFGLQEILGDTRENIAVMIEQLVEWNVDRTILAEMVSMGPNETYDVVLADDFYLTRSAVPAAPLTLWNSNPEDALRNACMRLVAWHENSAPGLVRDRVPAEMEYDFATNQFGQSLSGYRLGPDNPLGITYCGVPTEEAKLDGDADIALYSAPGIDGRAGTFISFFHRPDGWSTIGTGGVATQRYLQKGAISHFFLAPELFADGVPGLLSNHILARKFTVPGLNPLPPTFSAPLERITDGTRADIYANGDVVAFIQTGNALLFETALDKLVTNNVSISHSAATDTAFSIAGTYAGSDRHFSWIGFRDGDTAALIRIEVLKPRGAAPNDTEWAIVRALECSLRFGGQTLNCG